ncbi:MAG: ABC transporter permease [Candidatus Brocadiae bacterium]|nr:ABC transporter permease [Candidatus Brocadiia bacterium]
MKQYALKRLLISIPLVFVMTFVVFVIVNWRGATRFDTFENDPAVDPQVIELEKRRLGIYDPVPVRYLHWLRGVLFDLRVTQGRRFIASFEDNDLERGDDRYRYGGTESRVAVAAEAEYAVGGEVAAPARGLTTRAEFAPLLAARDFERLEFTAAAPAPKKLALVVMTGAGAVPFEFSPREDGTAVLTVHLDQLARRADPTQISELRYNSAEPGTARIRCEAVRRRIWQETLPGAGKRRAIQVEFRGEAGQYAELGSVKSPYTTKVAEGSDWDPDWAKAAEKAEAAWKAAMQEWEKAGRTGPAPERRAVEGVRFDRLEFEGRTLAGGAMKVEVQLLCGPPDAPVPAKLGEVQLDGDMETFSLPLQPPPPGVDLHAVRGLRFLSATAGRVELDDFRLRILQGAIGAGAPNFGTSWDKKKGVLSLIGEKVRNTIALNVCAIFFVWLIALPAGIYGAVRQYTMGDRTVSFLTYIGMAMPSFFLATLLVFVVSLTYDIPKTSWWSWMHGILPIAGRTSPEHDTMSFAGQMWDIGKHMILPVLVGVLGGIGGLQRIMRSMMLEERRKLYITTAMAKGLPPFSVLYKHALRNAIIPFIAGLGSLLPGLIGGSAFVEIVFDYPGIGRQMLESVQSYDIPVVMANTLIVGLLLVLGNLLADVLLAVVDPRISLEG